MRVGPAAVALLLAGLAASVHVPSPPPGQARVASLAVLPGGGWSASIGGVRPLDAAVDLDGEILLTRHRPEAVVVAPSADGPVDPRSFDGQLTVALTNGSRRAEVTLTLHEERLIVSRYHDDAASISLLCPTRVEKSTLGADPDTLQHAFAEFEVEVRPGNGAVLEFVHVPGSGCPHGAVLFEHMGTWTVEG